MLVLLGTLRVLRGTWGTTGCFEYYLDTMGYFGCNLGYFGMHWGTLVLFGVLWATSGVLWATSGVLGSLGGGYVGLLLGYFRVQKIQELMQLNTTMLKFTCII